MVAGSRLLIEIYDSRHSSDAVNVFALGANDTVNGAFDVLTALKIAVHNQMAAIKDTDAYDLFISLDQPMKVQNSGLVRATIIMSLGKFGPVRYYKLAAQITRSGDALGVKVLSVALARVNKGQSR